MKILEHQHVASVTADFPVGFSALFSGVRLYVAYYNADRNIAIGCRLPDGTWEHEALPSQVGWDSHRSIVMAVDRDNCIHVSGNMHADPLVYFKMERPHDLQSFAPVQTQVSSKNESRCTYPRFLKDPSDALLYAYRDGGSGNGATIVNRYDEKTRSFSRLSDKPLFDGLGEMSAYQSGPTRSPDGRYHLLWVWRNTPHCETNHDLSYAVSDDIIHWAPCNGEPAKLPITPRTSQFVVDPAPPGGGMINGGSALGFDPNQNPVIAYHKYDNNGNTQAFIARWQLGQWTSTQVSNWSHRWDFSGPGSITFEVQIGRPIVSLEQIVIPYWQIKQGHGQLCVDSNTLALIEDRSVESEDAYPSELLQPTSGLEGASVKWMPINPPDDEPDARYVLRWETLGKRRFYDPPETPVPPTSLDLYKLAATSK